jgi:hypothetical protein
MAEELRRALSDESEYAAPARDDADDARGGATTDNQRNEGSQSIDSHLRGSDLYLVRIRYPTSLRPAARGIQGKLVKAEESPPLSENANEPSCL